MSFNLGRISSTKIIVIAICFALASVFVYCRPSTKAVRKQISLRETLSDIKGWGSAGFIPLDEEIVRALKLDDYTNQSYSKGHQTVSLYVGYYFTLKKVGAAHDPLVCFPGQGWEVSHIKRNEFMLNSDTGESISYSEMLAQRGLQKELIIYWFQSYDQTYSDTFSQKIALLWKKLSSQGEDNAFVRISTAVAKKPLSECRESVFEFIRDFYPVFFDYIKR